MTDQKPKENLFAKMIGSLGKFLEAFADFVAVKPFISMTLVALTGGGIFTGFNTFLTASAHDHSIRPKIDSILTFEKLNAVRTDDIVAHQIVDEGRQERMPGFYEGKRKYDSAITKFHRDSLDLYKRDAKNSIIWYDSSVGIFARLNEVQ